MADKSEKTRARLPRGFADRSAEDIRAVEKMMATIRSVYELYGFEPADQPMIEYTDALGKFLPDQDRPNEGVFSFQDDDEQWLSLRYDLTAPTARFVAQNYDKLPKPYRSYRSGWVFRNEKPGPGRFRQFMQFDADTIGTPTGFAGIAADAEMTMMMADVMEALGIPRGQYVIRVNNRKILDGVLDVARVPEEKRLIVLRALDKQDKIGEEGVRLLLGAGRLDESGDFTKGANLDDRAIRYVLAVTQATSVYDLKNRLDQITGETGGVPDPQGGFGHLPYEDALNEMVDGFEPLVRAAGYEADRIQIDFSVVRGLEYYTGPVFEAELLAEIPNDEGQIVRFGSVGGGGRYDGLVSRFRGEPVPATGFSIGVSRLMTALKNLGKLDTSDVIAPVVVLVMDRDMESLIRYQKMVSELRAAGIRSEMYLGGSGVNAQFKYADRRKSRFVVVEGSDERRRRVVQIKDMAEGKSLSSSISDNAMWKEIRPGQFEVPRSKMVSTIKRRLAALAKERARGR
ncbi:histidine--tRNA ligase [Mesorhizobium sp.]|uniref:histidine--tRNA ligase n=1 Tax=Mesorhizobium sp. TaxID=1871066 RepID=UPI000FE9F17E|nr:histidine--tRNA ligase [Mesorhizobium sp.]RWD69203.1 MAG: histidine--tRNA ligase [Mesorhizobium sp.]TIV54380.1 MAG: histidine--tRNA ligase [Mesorhizobium sp.]TIW21012.1 MAG: histidine--tRNA ligase [Mesorhizobium sp.]